MLSRKACGKGLSIQSFSILHKIRDVDKVMTPQLQRRVFEVHPEVSFWALNKNSAMKHSKRSARGRKERIKLLGTVCWNLKSLLIGFDKKLAEVNDVLDAVVAAWTACRIAKGTHGRTSSVELDGRGLRMEIIY